MSNINIRKLAINITKMLFDHGYILDTRPGNMELIYYKIFEFLYRVLVEKSISIDDLMLDEGEDEGIDDEND